MARSNLPAARVIVVLRQSPDWPRLEAQNHDTDAFDRLIGRPPGTTGALIAYWNATFETGFYAVRARMKEITLAALAGVKDAHLVELDRCAPPYDERALYVFTDDDDWFAPHLAAALLGSPAAEADGAVWVSTRFDGTLLERPNDGFCYTNNYAAHGGFLARLGPEALALFQHMTAPAALNRDDVSLALLETSLSVTNKHPCSTVTIERARQSGPGLEALIERYSGFLHREAAGGVEAPAWARPMMTEVSAYFAGLRPRGGQNAMEKVSSMTGRPSRTTA